VLFIPAFSFPPSPSLFHRLVNSSEIEAADIIEKLNLREEKNLKLALFSLQKFIKVSVECEEAWSWLTRSRRRKDNLRKIFLGGVD
jgi:hypothetical protein